LIVLEDYSDGFLQFLTLVGCGGRGTYVSMPRCDGLPEGPCPGKKNDDIVRLGEGDLMLCKSCDKKLLFSICK